MNDVPNNMDARGAVGFSRIDGEVASPAKKKMRPITKYINLKGELFSSTFTSALSILIRLGSSLILTRLLAPEAYGVIGILFSVAFTLELISDVGATGLLIRNPRGSERKFVHTLWTIRLGRSLMNFALLYAAAPLIARIYGLPLLEHALRMFAWWFPLVGFESMSFIIAQRHQRSKISNYAELATSFVMTLFIVGMATVVKDYTVFIYGTLLQRFLMMVASHFFFREIGIGFAFDREAARDQFHFGKYVLPASILTIVLSQYDKVVLLKLFDVTLLGIYGLASNMIGPFSNLVGHNCRVVLYPRCAEYFRGAREAVMGRYYGENKKLFSVVTVPPMIIAGLSQLLVALLYDSRYQNAGLILMTMGIGVFFGALQSAAEQFLVAGGHTRVGLGGNIVRLFLMPAFTLTGYFLFGFQGFIWVGLCANVPVLLYFYRAQSKAGMLDLRAELGRMRLPLLAFGVCLVISTIVVPQVPPDFLRHALHLKPHELH